ncbi:MAG TPA: glycoside hydrolase family 97 C-terminal domain-containing protein, partial [Prolixibacteraceae bacterium]|nr:glycoside hydrolase family 97 C-terminal domain-containing protein [Prolixibacteraceae bacterium]
GNNTPNRGSRRITSDVFALATAVLFQSPVQHFALAPNNLTDAPDWAIDFMKKVPNTWDEIKLIDGYPGKYIIMARRSGDKWYVAGINAQSEPLNLKTTLSMIKPGSELKIYSDDQQLNGKVTSTTLSKSQEVNISIPSQGGFLLVD